MAGCAYTLAETAIGPVGFVWSERGIAGLQLPESGADATRARTRRRFPDAAEATPPASVREVIGDVLALLAGEPRDLSSTSLDLAGAPPFNIRVYEVALTIGHGETSTYGTVAARIGEPGAARAVGAALGQNPIPIIVPCHRVLAAGGRPGGFSAPGGALTKLRLLAIEGAAPGGQPDLFARARAVIPGLATREPGTHG